MTLNVIQLGVPTLYITLLTSLEKLGTDGDGTVSPLAAMVTSKCWVYDFVCFLAGVPKVLPHLLVIVDVM